MSTRTYNTDRRLDILVLGAMKAAQEDSSPTTLIGEAMSQLLETPEARTLMATARVTAHTVHVPDIFDDAEIVQSVLSRLDIADLVVLDLTPKSGKDGPPSPNVYYELALVHALGLPYILLKQEKTPIPFYMRSNNVRPFANYSVEAITAVLRDPLLKFLDTTDTTDFTDNRVTQFYEGLPIVDISAAIGITAGYYHNFVGRVLRVGGVASEHPDKVRAFVYVRPQNVLDTYSNEKNNLKRLLEDAGLELTTDQLPEPKGDPNGPLWIDRVQDVVIEVPRNVFPLSISPRMLALRERYDRPGYTRAQPRERDMLLRQTSERLLDRVEDALRYYVRKDGPRVRSGMLHFARFDDVVEVLRELGVTKGAT